MPNSSSAILNLIKCFGIYTKVISSVNEKSFVLLALYGKSFLPLVEMTESVSKK
jgi:hypothetical protein